ncbi:MAG: sugar ABC transporter substrate-binding protein [Rhodothermales bacterium]|nr:sugar ABC transporter substrate-binding protein [Rhodothermales bacterium]
MPRLLRFAVLLPALLLLGGCAAPDEGKGTVFYLVPSLLDEFQTESVKAIEEAFTALGYRVRVLDAQNRAEVQLNQLDDALLLGPAAVIIAAVDYDSVVPGIERVRAAGVPVLAFDRLVTGTQVDLSVVAGTVEMGRMAAREIVRLLEARHGAAQGTVLQIMGDPGDNYTLDIRQGFEETMQGYPRVQVVTKAAMQWEASNAGDIAEDQLLVQPDLDLIFVHAAHLAVPVVAVLEARGKAPGDVLLVSSNGAPVGLDLIRQGWEQVEIEQPLYAQVHGMARFVDALVAGEPPTPGSYPILGLDATLSVQPWGPTLEIPGSVITRENVDDARFWGNRTPPPAPAPAEDERAGASP